MAAAKKKPEAGKRLDLTFLSFVLILLTTGLVMLFSASYAYSYEYYGNSYKFITRQAAFAAAGVALMLIISKIDYHFWRKICMDSICSRNRYAGGAACAPAYGKGYGR